MRGMWGAGIIAIYSAPTHCCQRAVLSAQCAQSIAKLLSDALDPARSEPYGLEKEVLELLAGLEVGSEVDGVKIGSQCQFLAAVTTAPRLTAKDSFPLHVPAVEEWTLDATIGPVCSSANWERG